LGHFVFCPTCNDLILRLAEEVDFRLKYEKPRDAEDAFAGYTMTMYVGRQEGKGTMRRPQGTSLACALFGAALLFVLERKQCPPHWRRRE